MYDRQSDAFIQAADAGSFSRTAEALLISSTAVVKQIDLLEGSLGVQLFGRTPRGQTLLYRRPGDAERACREHADFSGST